MGRRDYEMEAATKAVEGRVSEPIVRALLVGSAGSSEGTLGGALKSLFGRSRRKAGLHSRNVLVLTTTSIRVFACDAHGWPPRARDEVGAWPVGSVRVSAEAAEKWSAFNASHSGSDEPLLQHHAHPDGRRADCRAVPPHRLGADDDPGARRRDREQAVTDHRPPRKKQQREREAAAHAEDPESAEAPD